jgi:hypothetical protein
VANNPPKPGQVVDLELLFGDKVQYSKPNCSTLLGEELTKQSCN